MSRLKLETRPMAPEFDFISQAKVEPLLRPVVPTRVLTANVYRHPAIRWEPEVPPRVPLTPAQRGAITAKRYAAVRAAKGIVTPAPTVAPRQCSDTTRGPGCGVSFTPRHPRTKRCPACALIVAPRLTTRSVIQRSRHPRYDAPELQAGNQ